MEATDTSNLRILGAYSARMAAGDYDAVGLGVAGARFDAAER